MTCCLVVQLLLSAAIVFISRTVQAQNSGFSVLPRNITARISFPARFDCQTNISNRFIRWSIGLGNEMLSETNCPGCDQMANSSLYIPTVARAHGGLYTCFIVGEIPIPKVIVYLTVAEAPRIAAGSTMITLNQDEPLEINVSIIGVPQPNIIWRKGSEVLNNNPRFTITGSNLSLLNAQYTDAGEYSITAQNIADTVRTSFDVIVRFTPVITITRVPDSEMVEENTMVTVTCLVTSNPQSTISWEQVTASDRINTTDHATTRVLTNNQFNTELSSALSFTNDDINGFSKFCCSASNDIGTATRCLNFTEARFSVLPRNITVRILFPARFDCQTNDGSIRWSVGPNNEMISESNCPGCDQIANDSLYIPTVTRAHGGLYTCFIVGGTLNSRVHVYLTVAELEAPRITPYSVTWITLNQDEPLEINVSVTGVPQPNITWRKGSEVLKNNPRFMITGSNLSLPNAQYTDAGEYSITAQNIVDTAETRYNVIVRFAPVITVTRVPDSDMVEENTMVTVTCLVTSNPQSTISWEQVTASGRINKTDHATTSVLINNQFNTESWSALNFTNDDINGFSKFCCSASNDIGTATRCLNFTEATIAVRIITPASDIIINQDETLEINVYVTGVPQPSITWSKNGEGLNDNPKFTITGSNLSLPNAQYTDAGIYKMTAQNIVNTAQRNYHVIIRFSPVITITRNSDSDMIGENAMVMVTCSVTSNPQSMISWEQVTVNDRIDKTDHVVTQLLTNNQFNTVSLSTISFTNDDINGFSEFCCIASNSIGVAMRCLNFTETDESNRNSSSDNSSADNSAIVGGTMGAVILLLIIIMVMCIVILCMRRSNKTESSNAYNNIFHNTARLNSYVTKNETMDYLNNTSNKDSKVTIPSYAVQMMPCSKTSENEYDTIQANDLTQHADLEKFVRMDNDHGISIEDSTPFTTADSDTTAYQSLHHMVTTADSNVKNVVTQKQTVL